MNPAVLCTQTAFKLLAPLPEPARTITDIFCCDLLSLAMARAPRHCAWVTVMANRNTIAVASLAEAACIIFAEGVPVPQDCAAKAAEEGIAVFSTELPVYTAARLVDSLQ